MSDKFQRELLRGSLDLIVLSVLADQPQYGYSIQKQVVLATDNRIKLPAGTLYPLLHRLEGDKLIRANWKTIDGRRRKYYELSAKGRKRLCTQGQQWSLYAECMTQLLGKALQATP